MNYFNRNKWWAVAFIALLILNVASLAAVWLLKEKGPANYRGPRPEVAEFLSKELGLDSLQKQQLFLLRSEHQQQAMELRGRTREAKDAFFSLLKDSVVSDSVLIKAAAASSLNDQQMDIVTFRHLQKIRALCTPEQKIKFDAVIHQVLRSMGPMQPPPPPGREGPPHPGDREPPPPMNK